MPPISKTRFDLRRDIFAVLFLALGIFVSLCLISYSPTDPAFSTASDLPNVKNWGGIVGAYIADFLLNFLLGIGAYVTAALLILISALQFCGKSLKFNVRDAIFYCLAVVFATALIHLRFETITVHGHEIPGGGIIGSLIGGQLANYLARPGAYIVSIAGFLLSFTLATRLSIAEIADAAKHVARFLGKWLSSASKLFWSGAVFASKASWYFLKKRVPEILSSFKKKKKIPTTLADPVRRTMAQPLGKLGAQPTRKLSTNDVVTIDPVHPSEHATAEAKPATETPPPQMLAEITPQAATSEQSSEPKILKRADARLRKSSEHQLMFHKMSSEGYETPPAALFDAPESKKIEIDEDTLKKNSILLESKLKEFDVEGKVVAIHPGPVITMYEFEPSAGTKVNKVVNLQDDLSLTLGGRSVRIVPHLPGKAALGIEVPNNERELVWLKDILSSPQYHKTTSHLPLALGSSTSGHSVVADLTKMPHLLVAGATGSGKSVAINSFIASIVCKSSPADVRFIMVDPKMLELSVYDGIPHLLLPVVTKPKPAVAAMRWAIREMERRYRLMADTGARNILSYNEKIKSDQIEIVTPEKAEEMLAANKEAVTHTGSLPYIVIIIDELADLMMTSSQDMEEAITRLAQMARAAGIHLILATQRPSVDVITGLIKANFPARMAFKVTSRHDSRTILDGIGAEALLGQGDMLFMTPQGGNLIRIHGCYITDSDITRVVAHLKKQGAPVYDESIIEEAKSDANGENFDEIDDELYDQAVKLVAETKQASISMVQRRLRIGYNRAARMIERMEAEGVVGPADGSKPRQVLANNI